MIKTGKLLKNNKGSALIMVFAVVFLLISFGTITLLAGVSNAQMGARYKNWSKEYYEVDQKAENYVTEVDKVLNDAENYARAYFENESYKKENDVPVFHKSVEWYRSFDFESDVQSEIHTYWKTNICKDIPENATSEEIEQYFHQEEYVSKLKDFNDQGFKKLYNYYAKRLLDESKDSIISKVNKNNSQQDNLIIFSNETESDYTDWSEDNIANYNGNKVLTVTINASLLDNATLNTYKSVNAQLNVQLPQYQTITQTRKVPIKTNPVWTNAITAADSIFFSDAPTDSSQQVKIYGDLFSADKNAQTDKGITAKMDDYLEESQNNGIMSNGAYVDVYGNVYSRGDLHVAQNNGSIVVNPYDTGTKVDLKRYAYSDSGLYVNTLGSDVDKDIIEYKQDTVNHIPFIFDDNSSNADNNGGNVYCNSLSVEECDKGTIEINGNVMMRDDVENNGTNSNITIKKNLIGISSESDFLGNPNASSSVTNNEPQTSNIVINGNFIIPGQIYLKFDSGNYATGISIGSWGKNNEILYKTFQTKLSGEKDSQFTEYTRVTDIFKLFTGTFEEKKKHTTDYFQQTSPSIDTSVSVVDKVKGYVLGTVIAKTNASPYSNVVQVADYMKNQDAYKALSGNKTLRSVLNAKTVGLGNDVYKNVNKSVLTNGFNAYVKKSELTQATQGITYLKSGAPPLTLNDKTNYIVYAEGNLTLTLNGTSSGIIYVAGNLIIDGNNEFDGTIICEGDVTISGHPTIKYSEAEIKKCLLANNSLREFFKPGESGQETFIDEASIDGIYKSTTVMKRYIINQWKEEQVPVNNTNGEGQ